MENENENRLEAENRRLKALLDERNIPYEFVGPVNRSNNRLIPVDEMRARVLYLLRQHHSAF